MPLGGAWRSLPSCRLRGLGSPRPAWSAPGLWRRTTCRRRPWRSRRTPRGAKRGADNWRAAWASRGTRAAPAMHWATCGCLRAPGRGDRSGPRGRRAASSQGASKGCWRGTGAATRRMPCASALGFRLCAARYEKGPLEPRFVASALECQAWCELEASCLFFSYFAPSGFCHLSFEGKRLAPVLNFVSGPKSCQEISEFTPSGPLSTPPKLGQGALLGSLLLLAMCARKLYLRIAARSYAKAPLDECT